MEKKIYLMYAIAFLQGMVFYGPVATLYRRVQGVSVFQITLIESISLILCLILEIPWGVIADKIGYKRTMVFCCILYFLSKVVFWRADSFWWFLLERIMLSIVIAGMSGVDTSILYLSCEKEHSQKTFGIYNSLSTAGLLLASLLFSVFIGNDYSLAGALTVISYGLSALAALFLTEVKPEKECKFDRIEFKTVLRESFRNRYLILFLIAVAFLSETHQTITVFLNQIQYEKCGLSASAIGYIYVAATIVGLLGIFSAAVTKKTGIKMAGVLLYGLAACACIVLMLTGSAALSIGGIITLRISNSLFQPFQTELQNRQVRVGNRATALSINAMITDSVGAGTNLAFGALAGMNLKASFLFGAILCLAGLCMFLIWHCHLRDNHG